MSRKLYERVADLAELIANGKQDEAAREVEALQDLLAPSKVVTITAPDFAEDAGAKYVLFLALGVLEHLIAGNGHPAAVMAAQICEAAAARRANIVGEFPDERPIALLKLAPDVGGE